MTKKIRLKYMNNNMTIDKRIAIKNYIFKKYTGQEVLECLSIEYPESYKHYYNLNVRVDK